MFLIEIIITFISISSVYPFSTPEDARLSVPELIKKHGYPVEEHYITTSDGYILGVHRIPHGKNNNIASKKPVLLQHGLFFSSADFVINVPSNTLGFMLADNGYDVWLGNSRGNFYSRNHTTLNPNISTKFWNFSMHEMGTLDLPATIDYILNVTNQPKLFYIGYSQGTTIFYILTTTHPEYNSKIRAQISLAPIAHLNHTTNIFIRNLAKWNSQINFSLRYFRINELLSKKGFYGSGQHLACQLVPSFCIQVFLKVFEYEPSQINTTVAKVWLGHVPAGVSRKQIIHFLQEINSGGFRWYDYEKDNVKIYGSDTPPSYNLSLVKTPCYLFYGTIDRMATEPDVSQTCIEMGASCAGKFPLEGYRHSDYSIGENVKELYTKIIKLLTNH